ncbi:hypothetical protein NDU88_000306 [Pleurodeles waltl]|uniref:Uncharacterized protein n=1 Tax=Pleurodeles waltl TaxID=8319 RepID=A0AAV7S471_PLEWA|nr:hypothetical protein NDU88_000306 [Pleurodeles waltl]
MMTMMTLPVIRTIWMDLLILIFYGPPEKRRRISPSDGGDVHPVSQFLVDHSGEPLFDPSLMVHPNSKEWYPADHVADYVSFFLRHSLDKVARNKLKSECPRPSLPDNITATPTIDPNMLMFFTKFGKDPKKGVDRAWSGCQDKLLDLVGPLTRIFDMAEEAKMDNTPIDPVVLSNWAQRAICMLVVRIKKRGLVVRSQDINSALQCPIGWLPYDVTL